MKTILFCIFTCNLLFINAQKINVAVDKQLQSLTIRIENPYGDAFEVAETIMFLTTCSTTYLLHSPFYKEISSYEQHWAALISWSLNSVGEKIAEVPKTNTLLIEISEALEKQDDFAKKVSYRLMRESLLLAWSPHMQDFIARHLQLRRLSQLISRKENKCNDLYSVSFNDKKIIFTTTFANLLCDKDMKKIQSLLQAYYSNIPQSFTQYPDITRRLKALYPYPEEIPEQQYRSGIAINTSERMYQIFLQYSMWERHVLNTHKIARIYSTVLLSSQEYSKQGQLDLQKVNVVANAIEKKLYKTFLFPIDVKRISWTDLNKRHSRKDNVSLDLQAFIAESSRQYGNRQKGWHTDVVLSISNLSEIPMEKTVYAEANLHSYNQNSYFKMPLFQRKKDKLVAMASDVEVKYTGSRWLIKLKDKTMYLWSLEGHMRFFCDNKNAKKEITQLVIHQAHISLESILVYELKGRHINPQLVKSTFEDLSIRKQRDNDYSVFYWNIGFDTGVTIVPVTSQLQLGGAP
ncbi:hypothetical protein [Candidatus Uabimicrobium sp. HlEnr_7]|uniref:hypothetical protein n=1 Tax=Candidatus Uabimicrobium helgolandensis TaxID=3095367 RepID=UPI0035574992